MNAFVIHLSRPRAPPPGSRACPELAWCLLTSELCSHPAEELCSFFAHLLSASSANFSELKVNCFSYLYKSLP